MYICEEKNYKLENIFLYFLLCSIFQKVLVSPSGNRTPVSRVTGGDTYHYTNEDLTD